METRGGARLGRGPGTGRLLGWRWAAVGSAYLGQTVRLTQLPRSRDALIYGAAGGDGPDPSHV